MPDIANQMNLTAAELRQEYGKALAMVAAQAAELSALRADQERMREALEAIQSRYYLADTERDMINAALASTPRQEPT